jgi:hypothetical protein
MSSSVRNSDGFKDQAKHSVVDDTIAEFRLDFFFAILETERDNLSAPGVVIFYVIAYLHKGDQVVLWRDSIHKHSKLKM